MTDPIYKEIGLRIKSIRGSRGLTQESMANHLGLSRTSMVHIENGNQRLAIDQLYKIAKFLSISVYDLLPEIDDHKGNLDLVSKERLASLSPDKQKELLRTIEKTRRK